MDNKPDINQLKNVIQDVIEIRFLDEGGYKAVYKANIGGCWEALKIIFIPREREDPELHTELLMRTKREIKSLKCCDSPFIVKLGSLAPLSCEIQDKDYLIYSEELLEGPTIFKLVRNGDRPGLTKCKILFICLLRVIKELKEKSLIHRDIKPKNIFSLEDKNRPYVVLDLGIAFKLNSTAITRNPNARLGTLPYMAPEIFNPSFRANLDYRSDLYSAAVTVYEFASGIHPIARRGEDDYTTIFRITRVKPTPLNVHRPDFPLSFCTLIDNLIRKNPSLRPSNLEMLIKKIEEIS